MTDDSREELGYDPTIAHPALSQRTQAGPYRLTDLIGGGGMGMVHRAIAPDGSVCAVKTLRADLIDPKAVRRFAREASVRIAHENVIKVLDDGADDDGTPYIVFELLEGESMEHRIARGPLTPDEIVNVTLQACAGLAAAHEVGIIHRDLKPANLFLCTDGTLKVLDFGIAILPTAPKVTATGMVLGTPAYLSPEQARGTEDVDSRADVWAMGAVMYEALCGSPPFDSDSFFATVVAILTEPVPPLHARCPDAPIGLKTVIHRCLAKDRDGRFKDADALAEALRAAVGSEGAVPTIDPIAAQPTMELSKPITSIPKGEERIVALVLAEGVEDYAAVETAIRERGGEPLTRFQGRVLGMFGGTRWAGDEAERAVEVALDIRPHVQRVAVSSGRAATAAGGIAGRAVSEAERGCRSDVSGVAVDAATAHTIERRFSMEQVGEGIFEVMGQRPPSWMAPQPTEVEQLLGREAQVAQIRFAIETALAEERAMTVLVTGPAGIGKSALRADTEQQISETDESIRIFVGRAEPVYHDTAWSFVASLLRRRAITKSMEAGWPRLDPSLPVDQRREAIARLAAEAVSDPDSALRCAEFLGEILGVRMPDSVRLLAARDEPRLMADRIRIAVSDWIVGHASQGPIAILLEDLDWADAASLDLIEQVLDDLADEPVLLFLTARSGQEAERLARHDAVQIRLKGLPKPIVGKLASGIVGRQLPEAVADVLAERTEGNPLFVRELVLALSEQGKLEEEALADQPLPLSIEAAVQSRLDLLGQEERELCKRASVFGRPFTSDDLAAVEIEGADKLLTELRRRDVIARHAAGAGRREYRFRSSLMNEIAYKMIAPDARAALHRQVAGYLMSAPGVDLEEVARHWDEGGEPATAADYYARACQAAVERGDSASVLRLSDRALTLGASEDRQYALHMARATAFHYLLQRDDQISELRQALQHASDDAELAQGRRQQAFWLCRAGHLDQAMMVGSRAVADADVSGDPIVRALARCALAQAYTLAGRSRDADAILKEADALASDAGPVARAQVAEIQGLSAALSGDVGRQREAYGKAVALYREAGNVREAATSEQNLADALNRVGAFEEAERALEEALAGCRQVKNRVGEAYALANLGYAATKLGKLDAALESFEMAENLAEEMNDPRLGCAVRIYRARTHLALEALDDAIRDADGAAKQARDLGLSSLAVSGLVLSASALLEKGEREAALTRSDEALALRDELGGIEEDEAEVFVVRARALEAAGKGEEAAEIRKRGLSRLGEVAERIADPELRSHFLRDVPAHRALSELGER